MTAFNSGFFKINKVNFNPISDIMLMFVKNGFLSPDSQNKFFLSFVLALKDIIHPTNAKGEKIDSRNLI